MSKEIVTRCDVDGKAASTYTLVLPGADEAIEVDLCVTHAKPVTDLAAKGRPAKLPSRRRQQFAVTPLKDTPVQGEPEVKVKTVRKQAAKKS